ncbi:MAG: STAS domain-containing protein [Chloroflexi bacterium]|nr:STAS domain-containing protein [Chloroflexota bacterium]MCY3937296.1 STAS domain-containing protein [Chloroflexota bacterium]MCY4109820.1 STAS domain-containing protein [Chloroflexota bacterium]
MAISTSREGQTLIVKTEDRIDGANAREFQVDLEAAIDPNDRGLVLDLEQLSYVSSAGLRVILLTAKTLRKQNAKLAVCSLSDSVREVFEISGFDKIIPVHDNQAEAAAALAD